MGISLNILMREQKYCMYYLIFYASVILRVGPLD